MPQNRLERWPLQAVDMRPCRVPEDDFLALMAQHAPLAPVEPRGHVEQHELQSAYNRGVRDCLFFLAVVILVVVVVWR